MVNTNALRARLKGQKVTIADLAGVLGESEDQIERYIDGSEDLTVDQAEAIQNALEIPDQRFTFYFCAGSQDYRVRA